ncbi:MAG TPA: PQQ-binding-like beta-propeller repeat protein [Planctomycetota bacterium]|nr:PQQ-binding-like beta-propeller repeat protein [Planctomycetota bacterium]
MRTPLAVLALLLPGVPAAAQDWPQWLGPTRDGVSAEKVGPWKGEPQAAWKVPVGEGHSSPIVAGGRVYLHVKAAGKEEEEVLAVDAATGKEVWRQSYARVPFESMFGHGPRATPLASGNRLYTLGVTGVLTCWEAATGKQVWQKDLLQEFGAPNLKFGVSCSPILEGDLLMVNIGGPGASIVALKKDSGEPAWKAMDDKASYSSPIVTGTGADRQVIFLTQKSLVGLSPADGKVFWSVTMVDKLSESSSTPLLSGGLLLGSSITSGSTCVKLESKDGKPGVAEAWKNPKLNCYMSTPMAVGKDRVYMVTGKLKLPPSATLRCVDAATGKEFWNKPDVGLYHASLIRLADGKLLMMDDGGSLELLDPNDTEYKELAKAKICGPTWAHPALAGGRLYIRDHADLLCVPLGD